MSISLQTNVNSLVAQQNLNVTNKFQSQTITQLTSGYRINSAGDDAAGLAVANKFRSGVAELTQGVANGNDATAQLQIMDGGMTNISMILDRLKTLATQSASGTFTGNRGTLNSEFQSDISEIDRQAQSIGLDTGGTFAKNLSVYLGQGTGSGDGSGGAQALSNASVGVDLSQATVDAGSLGLKGMKAIAGTVSSTGTDIGTGSSNGTTVQDIVSALAGNSQAKTGYATFNLSGPGFSDNSKVSISANLSGVSDTNTLVTAINQAIAGAAGGSSQADQALQNAGITATVNTDQYGHQQLAFSSSTTAFQVQAGDQMANALMGNFASAGSATGKAVTTTVTGGTTGLSTAGFTPANVSVQISGAGLSGPVTLSLSSADAAVSTATADVIKQVNQNAQLQAAGISVAMTSDNKLQFTSATGASFNVSSVGDTSNALGLGTFVTTTALNGAASYSDISAATSYATAATGNGVATLGVSLDGGATGGITAATVTGAVTGTGYNGGATLNGTVGNAAGALGTMTLTLNGSSSPVTVDFSKDANQSGTETLQQAANFINSQIQSQAGYGSDVQLAKADTATNTIMLSGPADGAGTISAAGAAATKLGLTADSGANIVAASGSAGNTVSVNLAGGDATSAVATGSAAAPTNVATGTNTMALSIDGVTVNANFSQDVNAPGAAAAFTSSSLGANGAATTVNVSALQGGAATVSTGVLGALGAASTVALNGFAPGLATTTGTAVGGTATLTTSTVVLSGFASKVATDTSGALGAIANADLTGLNLSQYQSTAAKAVGGVLGTDSNSAVDLSAFQAKAATATGTVSLGAADGSTAVDFSAYGAQKAKVTGNTAVAANDITAIAALSGLDSSSNSKLIVNGTAIAINTLSTLDDVVGAINGSAAGTSATGVVASDANGVLTITNKLAGSANPIDIVANAGSQAVGLSTIGQITDTTATGAGTPATMTGYSVSANNTTAIAAVTALDATAPKELTINGTAIDIHGAADLNGVATLINGSSVGATVKATANTDGTLTLANKVAGAATIDVTANAASLAVGLSNPSQTADSVAQGTGVGELQLAIDGKGTINVDISKATNASGVVSAINTALAATGTGYGSSNYGAVASLTANGDIKLTSYQTGQTGASAGEVHVVQNAVSDALGLTSGSVDTDNLGTDATKLKLSIDGLGEQDVDVSHDTTLGQVAASIDAQLNSAVGYGASYNTAVSGATGNLTFTSVVKGTAGSVNIKDNLVSEALKLTTTGDNNKQGNNATDLKLNIDGHGEVDVDVSGQTNLNGVVTAINTALHTAAAVTLGYDNTYTYAQASTTTTGAIDLLSKNKGATGTTAGSVQVVGNAVSSALQFASSTVKGTDTQTLNLQMDGHQELDIDLSGAGTVVGTPTVGEIATAINTALTGAAGIAAGYGANYANKAVANAGGTLTISGYGNGGSLKITNNAMSKELGLASGTADTVSSEANKTLNLQIDGNQQVDIDLSGLGANAKLSDIANAINTALVGDTAQGYGAAYANVATANSNGTISLTGVQGGGTVTVKNSLLSSALSITSTSGDATNTGAAAQTLGVSIDGKATTQVSFAGITGGKTPTLQNIADAINAQLTKDTNYGASYANAKANADGTITIDSKGTGSAGGQVTVYNNAAGQALGLTSGIAASSTVTGKDESLANVVSFLNTTAQQALGTSTAAKIVSLDASGNLNISSQTAGANSSVSVLSSGTTGGLAASLNLSSYVDHAATGTARSLQSVVDDLQKSFNGNTTLQQAGLTAQINQGTNSLEIKSSNGTQFSLDAWGTKNGTNNSDLGFGDTGQAFTQANTTLSSSSVVDTQGASAIGTSANGAGNTASIAFQGMQFGNDTQSLTISANSAAGVAQTPLTITLQNNSTAQTGASIDSAISAINTKLQQSNNATLRSITAVQETGANGKESINLISSLSSFNVSVGSSAGASVGDGLNSGKAQTFSSATNGAASSIAIDTQAGAEQAVAAIANAVSKLGSAQATIGIGENQLGYAINLAQSQITNFSSAESQIRDTNVAQQAANMSKAQVLSQAAIAAMAQANSAPQGVLALLRG